MNKDTLQSNFKKLTSQIKKQWHGLIDKWSGENQGGSHA